MRYDGGGVSLVAAAGGRGEVGGEDLKEGDELLLSYGPRLAEELLHVYGFLPVRRRKIRTFQSHCLEFRNDPFAKTGSGQT
jgi:hypothetical protein